MGVLRNEMHVQEALATARSLAVTRCRPCGLCASVHCSLAMSCL